MKTSALLLATLTALIALPATAQEIDTSAPAPAPTPARTPEATIDLEWEAIEDASAYEVELTPLKGGTPLRFSSTESRVSKRVPVGPYRLRIRSRERESGLFGAWSDPTEVEVEAKRIELYEPADKSEIEIKEGKKLSVTFMWSPVPRAKVYTLKIWSDDGKKMKEFKTTKTNLRISLPGSRVYHWQVTFDTRSVVGYESTPNAYSFTLKGPQLPTPVVGPEVKLPKVETITWSESKGAEFYQAKILRRDLDETDWSPFAELEKTDAKAWDFKKLPPGAYRIEVTAHALHRVSSEAGFLEFVVKPTEQEMAQALSAAIGMRAPAAADVTPKK